MSAEEESRGGLGKSIVLVILGLFVLYYGIEVMKDRSGQGGHGEVQDSYVEETASEPADEGISFSSAPSPEKPSAVDVDAVVAENAQLKGKIAELEASLNESNQKLGAVRTLLEAEAVSTQE